MRRVAFALWASFLIQSSVLRPRFLSTTIRIRAAEARSASLMGSALPAWMRFSSALGLGFL